MAQKKDKIIGTHNQQMDILRLHATLHVRQHQTHENIRIHTFTHTDRQTDNIMRAPEQHRDRRERTAIGLLDRSEPTSNGDFGGPLGCAVQYTLFHRLHVTRMDLVLDRKYAPIWGKGHLIHKRPILVHLFCGGGKKCENARWSLNRDVSHTSTRGDQMVKENSRVHKS